MIAEHAVRSTTIGCTAWAVPASVRGTKIKNSLTHQYLITPLFENPQQFLCLLNRFGSIEFIKVTIT
jgi:hypothetical protein